MRTLYFGGSFNPIHHGHLICARIAAEVAGFQSVMLIPCAQPPHKPISSDLADASHRLEMCRLACSLGFEVSDIELNRPAGPSFTLDTVRQFAGQTRTRISWLIGADMLNLLPKWHEPQALLREVDFVVMARPGWQFDWNRMPQAYQTLKSRVVQTPLIDISATEIRKRVRQSLPIDFLTPAKVCEYIRSRNLYR